MDPDQPQTHKRSKSGIAKSLLHRAASKSDNHNRNSLDEPPVPQSTSSASLTSLAKSLHVHHSNVSTSSAQTQPKAKQQKPPNPGPVETMATEVPDSDTAAISSPLDQKASLEETVKMFRLFEALRSGNRTAILKHIRESGLPSDSQADEQDTTQIASETNSVLHLAVQCADMNIIEWLLNSDDTKPFDFDLNSRDRHGNTPLHIATSLGRSTVVRMLIDKPSVLDFLPNHQGQTALDLARAPDIFELLQLSRSMAIEKHTKRIQELMRSHSYDELEELLVDVRVRHIVDVNASDLATDPITIETGGTLLHQAARSKDVKLIQFLLLNGADPFKRDRKGKLPQDVTKDDRTKAILKRSPAAAAAQRGIQEKTILGTSPLTATGNTSTGENPLSGKEAREMKGFLKKWTNYTGGHKLRWFILEDGVLSYYKHQDDAGSACRGAINMKIAKLYMDPQDKLRFEIHGKSSVKYHLKANHQVEAKRWFWALNNAIQWTKDEAKEEEKKQIRKSEALHKAKGEHLEKSTTRDGESQSIHSSRTGGKLAAPTQSAALASSATSALTGSINEDEDAATSTYEPSEGICQLKEAESNQGYPNIDGDMDDEDDYLDETSSHDPRHDNRDIFSTTAQSLRIQLELLEQLSTSLQSELATSGSFSASKPTAKQSISTCEAAVENLKALAGDLLRISRDRDIYWQNRLDREVAIRRMWEENMTIVVKEQEDLQNKIGKSEEKRRQTKRMLKDALGANRSVTDASQSSRPEGSAYDGSIEKGESSQNGSSAGCSGRQLLRQESATKNKAVIPKVAILSDTDTEDEEEEFFDAIGSGDAESIIRSQKENTTDNPTGSGSTTDLWQTKSQEIIPSFKGYEDAPRQKLKMDYDNRPKSSLWAILKSMIGKDMTRITLPVSFNEPTSLLQRVAEDMEYAELLNNAADRPDPTERMVYVATFAASEYASTIGRVAKPFNPLLGETYEYARPDQGYRFFIEQVSHHPPIGAAHAESDKWDYYGESAIKSKFYGKSFDINLLGTWFLRLRPCTGGEELYTWRKITSSVIGIISGNPTVDNYGLMEIKNWTTGETCLLDFKPRGWKASSAYSVSGKVLDASGSPRWGIAGHWNDKIFARPLSDTQGGTGVAQMQAFLVWTAHERPSGLPFNLTPFVITLNALPERLRPLLAPTDTRLRPDQRAMEEGEYDLAATEKNRVEEKQRARRRERETNGEDFRPKWFQKCKCEVTGEEYWGFSREYWSVRDGIARGAQVWEGLEDIF